MGKSEVIRENEWQLERDLDALIRSEAIKNDPDRYKKVKAHAKKKLDEHQRKKTEAETAIALGQEK